MIRLVLVALLVTLAVEVPVVAAFYPRQRVRMAVVCAIATIAASLTVNGVLAIVTTRFASWSDAFVALGEVAAMLLEAAAYYAVARPRDGRRALAAAAAANIASYAAGLLLGS